MRTQVREVGMEITQEQFFYTTLDDERSVFYEEVHRSTPYEYETTFIPCCCVICGDIFRVVGQDSVRTGE